MIDTIILLLSSDMYQVTSPEKFTPSARWTSQKAQWGGLQSKQNPSKKDLLGGVYKPRLTLSHRRNVEGLPDIVLRIELSLPKLLFGNNFVELRYKDFTTVLQKLVVTLDVMGVAVEKQTLEQAPIVGIHYSKNIPLTDGSTPYHYIRQIKEADVSNALDTNQTDYRNEGHSYKWHCNAYEVVFYDKLKDLEAAKKSSKRAIEENNELQLHLFEKLRKQKKFELLRMEVRLNKRQKMKQLFGKLDIKADLTFKKLFKPAISKKVLLHYLDELERGRSLFLDYKHTNDKNLLAELRFNNPALSPKRIIQIFGMMKALQVFTLRELKVMFPQRGWHRLMADAKDIQLSGIQSPLLALRKHL
jgi:hypothetical protein